MNGVLSSRRSQFPRSASQLDHKEHSLGKLNLDTSIYSFIKEMIIFCSLLILSSLALRKKGKKKRRKYFFFPHRHRRVRVKEPKCACNVCNFMREHVAIIIQFSSCSGAANKCKTDSQHIQIISFLSRFRLEPGKRVRHERRAGVARGDHRQGRRGYDLG